MALTDAKVRNAKPKAKRYKIYDGEGLSLLIVPTGGKYWRFTYRFAGKEKLLAFGVYPEVTLADARERRAQARKALAAGSDPGEIKKEVKRIRIANPYRQAEALVTDLDDANDLKSPQTFDTTATGENPPSLAGKSAAG